MPLPRKCYIWKNFYVQGIFDLSLILNGFPIGKARRELARVNSIPQNDFQAFDRARREELAKFHMAHNSFYKTLAGTDFKSWESLPVMTKRDLQRPLAERLSNGYGVNNVFVNKTSGSGGDPMVFAKDKFCHAIIWANIMRRFGWYGVDFNHSYQARFYGMPLDFLSNAKIRVKDFFARRYRFSIFDLSDKGLKRIVDGFQRRKFDYINGYTNTIVLLAKYLRSQNIVLRDVCPTLKVCVTTSEMLFDEDRELLKQWLGVPIVNEYGASELDVIAFEHPDGRWLVNAETTYVEIVDDSGKPVPNGTEGRIVVTSLYNKAHPMIRYEVGDWGVLDESSTAKFPVLKSLTGRTNDLAVLPSGKKPAGMTFYSITKKLFGDQGNVKEFVIRQIKLDTFEIVYTSEAALGSDEIRRIEKTLEQYLEPGLHFNFIRREKLERTKSGKLKQFESLIDP